MIRKGLEGFIRNRLCFEIDTTLQSIHEYFWDFIDFLLSKGIEIPDRCGLELFGDLLTRTTHLFSESKNRILPSLDTDNLSIFEGYELSRDSRDRIDIR